MLISIRKWDDIENTERGTNMKPFEVDMQPSEARDEDDVRHLKRKMDITRKLIELGRAVKDADEATCAMTFTCNTKTDICSKSDSGQEI